MVEASQDGNDVFAPAVSVDQSFTVNTATLTILPDAGQSKVYGAAVPGLTETATGFVNGDSSSLLTGALGTMATSSSAVGTYAFTLGSLDAGPNYTVALAASPPTFAVTAAPLSIHPDTGQSKVYGAAVPGLTATATGFVNGDTSSLLTGALGTMATASSAVGSYSFTLGSLDAGPNYVVAIAASPPTFAVTSAPLSIQPNSGQSKVYGAAVPGLTETATGFVNGDSSSLLTGASARWPRRAARSAPTRSRSVRSTRDPTTPWRWPTRRRPSRSPRRRSPFTLTPANPRSMPRRCRA